MQRRRGREDARRGPGLTTSSLPAGAIVAAGGLGLRSGARGPKQFVPLAGRPLFMWSVTALSECGCEPVVVALPADHLEAARDALGSSSGAMVVAGGDTRQASVFAALQHMATETVIVHDAARPFVDPEVVDAVLGALEGADAAIPVLPIHETVKHLDSERVLHTVDRSPLGLAQTPQAFRADVLRSAHERAQDEGFEATDDAQLIEHYGGVVTTVPGSRKNIKITYPEDFSLAEAVIRS